MKKLEHAALPATTDLMAKAGVEAGASLDTFLKLDAALASSRAAFLNLYNELVDEVNFQRHMQYLICDQLGIDRSELVKKAYEDAEEN